MGFSSFGDTLNFFFLYFVAIVLFSLVVEVGRCFSSSIFYCNWTEDALPREEFLFVLGFLVFEFCDF